MYFQDNINRIVAVMINLLKENLILNHEELKKYAEKALLNSPKFNHDRNNADWVITYLANDAIKLI
ncbi:MAG: hypothetical protein RLZZ210_625 [Pseudomonadota bacterium]|jgi:hypothetical protein